jgi:COP9 signalosome complex subunit 2
VEFHALFMSPIDGLFGVLSFAENRESIMDDSFIRMYIEDVLRNIRTQVLIQLIKPYTQIEIEFAAKQLGFGITVQEVEELLVGLILDDKIKGKIDQVHGRLQLDAKSTPTNALYESMDKWSNNVSSLYKTSINKLVV